MAAIIPNNTGTNGRKCRPDSTNWLSEISNTPGALLHNSWPAYFSDFRAPDVQDSVASHVQKRLDSDVVLSFTADI